MVYESISKSAPFFSYEEGGFFVSKTSDLHRLEKLPLSGSERTAGG